MKRLLLISIIIIAAHCLKAQTWSWARNGTGGSGNSRSIATDLSGNIFIAGNFDDGHITFGAQTLYYSGQSDAYIAKYDAAGNVLWAKSIGGSCGDYISAICTDIIGNVYVTGFFCSYSLNVGGISLNGYNGFFNVFVAKYDVNGNVIWAKTTDVVSTCDNFSNAVAVDNLGNCFIAGSFTNHSITFGSYTLLNSGTGPSGSNHNLFITKYDVTGNVVWAKKAGSTDYAKATSICTDASGNAYITGGFKGVPIAFDGFTLPSSGDYDMFITKYNSDGTVAWARSNTGAQEDYGNAITCDASGNIYATGYFRSPSMNIGGIILTNTYGANPSLPANMYVTKYNNAGTVIWAKNAGGNIGSAGDMGYSVSTYNSGVYVSGKMNPSGFTAGTFSLTAPSPNYFPLFVANYNNNGDVLYATVLPGGASISNDIAVDNTSNLYVTGNFNSSVNPFVIGGTSFTPTGIENIFLAKLSSAFGPLPVTLTQFNINAGNRQLNLSWHTEQESNIDGYYIQRSLSGNTGFTSLKYTLAKRNSTSNDYSFTDNDISKNTTYFYRLAIVENGTIKRYSEIRSGRIAGSTDGFLQFENPTNGKFILTTGNITGSMDLSVINNAGQVVFSLTRNSFQGNSIPVNISQLPSGVYWLQLKTGKAVYTGHIQKL